MLGLKDVVPFQHEDLDIWRSNFKGIRYIHESSNLLVTGAIDDVWVKRKFRWTKSGRLATSARWRCISGCSGKTDSKFLIQATSSIVTARLIVKLLMPNLSLT